MTSAGLAVCIGRCALLLAPGRSVAESPRPPCAVTPSPAYADLGSLPAVRVWTSDELGTDWLPPACTGWHPIAFRTLVAAAGRFRSGQGSPRPVWLHLGSGDDPLLVRLGAALGAARYQRFGPEGT